MIPIGGGEGGHYSAQEQIDWRGPMSTVQNFQESDQGGNTEKIHFVLFVLTFCARAPSISQPSALRDNGAHPMAMRIHSRAMLELRCMTWPLVLNIKAQHHSFSQAVWNPQQMDRG